MNRTFWRHRFRKYHNFLMQLLSFLKTDRLRFPPCRTPFSWRTPHGYLVALLIESAGFYSASLMGIPCHCLFIGSCYVLTFLVECITKDVANLKMDLSIDRNGQRNSPKTQFQSYVGAYLKFRAHFCDISQRFSDTRK